MKYIATLALTLFTTVAAHAAPVTHDFDKSHTSILFFVSHAGFSMMQGEVLDYDGYLDFDRDNPENSKLVVTMDPAGIDTGSDALNKKMPGEHFFDKEQYGEMKFESTEIEQTGPQTAKVTGDLTMRGVTKPVTLDVTFNKEGEFYGQRIGFSATGELERSDWGMEYQLDSIGDDIKLRIETEFVKRDVKP